MPLLPTLSGVLINGLDSVFYQDKPISFNTVKSIYLTPFGTVVGQSLANVPIGNYYSYVNQMGEVWLQVDILNDTQFDSYFPNWIGAKYVFVKNSNVSASTTSQAQINKNSYIDKPSIIDQLKKYINWILILIALGLLYKFTSLFKSKK